MCTARSKLLKQLTPRSAHIGSVTQSDLLMMGVKTPETC